MKDLVREVTQISLANRNDETRYWGRIAGTRGEEMAREWVEAKFRELDLSPRRDAHFVSAELRHERRSTRSAGQARAC